MSAGVVEDLLGERELEASLHRPSRIEPACSFLRFFGNGGSHHGRRSFWPKIAKRPREGMKTSKPAVNEDERPGTTVTFPYDRMSVERFRMGFPRARWSDELKAWFVPGKTAAQRFDRWLAREEAGSDVHAEMKGRDAYKFDPIVSKYLIVHDDRLELRTPYSRTIVAEMREISFASWDADRCVWTVPYRSYDELRRHWNSIEAAAERNTPEERKARRAERRGSAQEHALRARAAERRNKRHPVQADDVPPLDRPVMTRRYGVVVFTSHDAEPVDLDVLRSFYADLPANERYVWGHWRRAELQELVKTWPSRSGSKCEGAVWWQPSLEELRAARKAARTLDNRRKARG